MRADVTLGEVRARCVELTSKYGDECCKHCEFSEIGCCDAPELWNLDNCELAKAPCCGPNYEELCKALIAEKERLIDRLNLVEADNESLQRMLHNYELVVATVEAMIGREIKM